MNASPEPPSPEKRSDAALLCFCIGVGFLILSWLMGIGGVIAMALAGDVAAIAAGGVVTVLLIPLVASCGVMLALVGGVWMLARVIADSQASDKYSKDVQR